MNTRKRCKQFVCCSFIYVCFFVYDTKLHSANPIPPYPQSPVIQEVHFDFSTHKRMAPGSDNFPTTWAADGNIYTVWGDGGGFGGTNSNGRVKLGVARVEGDVDNYQGFNVWGGFEPEFPAEFEGKSYGILSVEGTLYMWVAPQPNPHLAESRVASSTDFGRHWQRASWAFQFQEQLSIPTFLNFGQDYDGARDEYVYSYFIHPMWGPGEPENSPYGFDVHKPGKIYLSRTAKNAVLVQSQYSFFAGLDEQGEPLWRNELTKKQPVFEDANGVGWNVSVSYNTGLKRYILSTEHTKTHAGCLGMFDAPEPWGPWTTIAYTENFGESAVEVSAFYWNFCTKWLSENGKSFTLLFTGKNSNDSWNTVDGEFVLSHN